MLTNATAARVAAIAHADALRAAHRDLERATADYVTARERLNRADAPAYSRANAQIAINVARVELARVATLIARLEARIAADQQ